MQFQEIKSGEQWCAPLLLELDKACFPYYKRAREQSIRQLVDFEAIHLDKSPLCKPETWNYLPKLGETKILIGSEKKVLDRKIAWLCLYPFY